MKRLLALLLILLVAGASGKYTDQQGDALPAHDLVALGWDVAGSVKLDLVTAGTPDADAGYTVILFQGSADAAEPTTWSIAHTGPGGDALQHGHDGSTGAINVSRDGTVMRFQFDLERTGDCRFAVARSVTYPVEGQQVEDVIGWSTDNIGDAWNQGRACTDGQPKDAVLDSVDANTTPGPGLLVVGLAMMALLRRQR